MPVIVSSLKGGNPTKNSYTITPNDHQSIDLLDMDMPFMTSGGI